MYHPFHGPSHMAYLPRQPLVVVPMNLVGAIDPLKDPLAYSMQYINKDFGGSGADGKAPLANDPSNEGVKQGEMARE